MQESRLVALPHMILLIGQRLYGVVCVLLNADAVVKLDSSLSLFHHTAQNRKSNKVMYLMKFNIKPMSIPIKGGMLIDKSYNFNIPYSS